METVFSNQRGSPGTVPRSQPSRWWTALSVEGSAPCPGKARPLPPLGLAWPGPGRPQGSQRCGDRSRLRQPLRGFLFPCDRGRPYCPVSTSLLGIRRRLSRCTRLGRASGLVPAGLGDTDAGPSRPGQELRATTAAPPVLQGPRARPDAQERPRTGHPARPRGQGEGLQLSCGSS